MLKRFLAALAAVALSGTMALAVISGIKSDSQDQQVAMGQLQLGQGLSTGTNTPTINAGSGIITTAALATALSSSTTITLTNNRVAVGDSVQCTLDPNGSTGTPVCANAAVTAGQVVFTVANVSTAAALNAAVKIYFVILKGGNPN